MPRAAPGRTTRRGSSWFAAPATRASTTTSNKPVPRTALRDETETSSGELPFSQRFGGSHATTTGIHAGRTPRSHRDHRDPDRRTTAGAGAGPCAGQLRLVHVQPPADGRGVSDVR